MIKARFKVEEADFLRIRSLVKGTGVFIEEEMDVAVELAQISLEKGPEKSGYNFIFLEEEELLGYICYGRTPFTRFTYDLYWIVVNKTAQRQGIAKQLMKLLAEALKEEPQAQIVAETSGLLSYEAARRFYINNGFVESACLPDFYDINNSKLIYIKKLWRN
jgi:ribosomal protein S18 acetylase RimI-like enzyme